MKLGIGAITDTGFSIIKGLTQALAAGGKSSSRLLLGCERSSPVPVALMSDAAQR